MPHDFTNNNAAPLPYRTIDVIFNNRNIFLNHQHFDPNRIYYDIWNPDLWKPFLKD